MRKPRERQDIPSPRCSLLPEPIHFHCPLTRRNNSPYPPRSTPLCSAGPDHWPVLKGSSRSYGTAAEDTLVGQAGREQLVGTEDLSMLVRGPVVLAGPWRGPEPRGGVRFCRWEGEGGRRKRLKSFARTNLGTSLKFLYPIPCYHLNQALASAFPARPPISERRGPRDTYV